jgi:CheY-like chemotaxis protein
LGRGYRYEVELLILQLRLETVSALQNLPILVQIADENQYMSKEFCGHLGLTETEIQRIGVDQIAPGEPPSQDRAPRPDPEAVRRYIQRRANRPIKEGRHALANRWGPYTFFRVLEELKPRFSDRRDAVELVMFEEPYLKRLARVMRDGHITSELRKKLREEMEHFADRLLLPGRDRKILVIEDQLDAGWREVYETFLRAETSRVSVEWASTVAEAQAKFAKDVDLVVLDVRLDQKDEELREGYEGLPSGVTLAEWLREQSGTVPIFAATASNKTWIMERLLQRGIQGYWVKESPEQGGDLRHAARNVLDLYQKVREIVEWSDRTRPWVEGLYEIAQEVSESDPVQGRILGEKAKSLHSLLHRAFSPFSRELDEGLQLNVAFLILFSCINDVRAWCLRLREIGNGNRDWLTVDELGEHGGVCIVRYRAKKTNRYEVFYSNRSINADGFEDIKISEALLDQIGCDDEAKTFDRLRELRNRLPLTHRASDAEAARNRSSRNVTDNDLTEMLLVLRAVVEKRRFARSNGGPSALGSRG